MELVFLGTDAMPIFGETVCFLVKSETKLMLAEACSSILQSLQKVDVDFSDINYFFISHVHGDHSLGFLWIMNFIATNAVLSNKEKGNKTNVEKAKLYVSRGVLESLKMGAEIFFPRSFVKAMSVLDVLNISALESRLHFDKDMYVEFFPLEHTVENYGFKIVSKDGETKLAYVPDTVPNKLYQDAIRGAEILIHECFLTDDKKEIARKYKHTTAKELGLLAEKTRIKTLIPVHISHIYGPDKESILKEIREYYSGELINPMPGQVITIS